MSRFDSDRCLYPGADFTLFTPCCWLIRPHARPSGFWLVRPELSSTQRLAPHTQHRCRSSRPRPQCRYSRHLWLHQNTSPVPLDHASHPLHRQAMPVRPMSFLHIMKLSPGRLAPSRNHIKILRPRWCVATRPDLHFGRACPSSVSGLPRTSRYSVVNDLACCPYSAGGLSVVRATLLPGFWFRNLSSKKFQRLRSLVGAEPVVTSRVCEYVAPSLWRTPDSVPCGLACS